MKTNKLLFVLAILLSFSFSIYAEEGGDTESDSNDGKFPEVPVENTPLPTKRADLPETPPATPQPLASDTDPALTPSIPKAPATGTKPPVSASGSQLKAASTTQLASIKKQKDSARQRIEGTKSSDYPEKSRDKFTGLQKDTITDIENAQSPDDINNAIKGYNDKIAEIPTQKTVDSLKNEINSYFKNETKIDDYTSCQIAEIEKLKSKCREEIDSSETESDMREKIKDAKKAIDKVLTAKEQVDLLTFKVSELENQLTQIRESDSNKTPFEFVKEQITALAAILLGLVILALLIVNTRITKRKFADNTASNDKTQKAICEIQGRLENTIALLNDQKTKYYNLEGKISNTETSLIRNFNDFKNKNIELQKTSAPVEKIMPEVTLSADLVEYFNNWAYNPRRTLPLSHFYYLKSDIKIRSEQTLVEVQTESKWITNRLGNKKYLFPNPRFFDEATDIKEFYKTTGALKAKNHNAIKVTEPCEIADKGYINYPGKLAIL
jgi:hypothetical protein